MIGKHVRNIFNESELEESTSRQILPGSKGINNSSPQVYNLDVIISVGYRLKSSTVFANEKEMVISVIMNCIA